MRRKKGVIEGKGEKKERRDRPIEETKNEKRTISMDTFSSFCTVWHQHVKEFIQSLHGHQRKILALFVLGAIRAESIVIAKVAEALLGESEAKTSSIERRLQRFLSNKRINTVQVWKLFLETVLPFFQKGPVKYVVDVTSYEEHAQVITIGILYHSRVFPLVWKVMPGQEKWDQGLWSAIGELFDRIAPSTKSEDVTIVGDSAFG
jgi:hypothetical protein